MTQQWVGVVDSAVTIGLGAVAAGVFALTLELIRQRHENRRQADELRRAQLVDPIITFVDDLMAAIGEVYWSHIDGTPPREKMLFFRERQGAVEARVAALRDPVLSEKWPVLSRKVIEVKIRIGKPELGDPYEKMKEAFALGGEVLRSLLRLR